MPGPVCCCQYIFIVEASLYILSQSLPRTASGKLALRWQCNGRKKEMITTFLGFIRKNGYGYIQVPLTLCLGAICLFLWLVFSFGILGGNSDLLLLFYFNFRYESINVVLR